MLRMSLQAATAGVDPKKLRKEIDLAVAQITHDAYHSDFIRKRVAERMAEEERMAAVAALSSS